MIGKRMKHAKRYQEISNAFIRNGFSYVVYRLFDKSPSKKSIEAEEDMNLRTIGVKLRMALQELGPTFVKLGQIASTRRDLIPEEITGELEQLQDQVSSFSIEQVRAIIAGELGGNVEEIFTDFHEEPLATASIGQVHLATLQTGEQVAIKIQRPDIQKIVNTDLEILDDLAGLMEAKLAWAKTYQIRKIIEEFSKSLFAELDYTIEGRNGERVAKQFIDQPEIHIPRVYWDYSTRKVLTMEYVQGIKVSHLADLDGQGYDRKIVAERLTNAMLHQILIEGFFHGDPHPGNIYVLPNQVISFIDFGMVGKLNEEMKYHLASLVIHLQRSNTKGLLHTFSSMGILPDDIDMNSLYDDIEDLQMKYYDVALSKMSLGGTISDLFSVAFKHQIQIPVNFTVLGKALLTVEGIVEDLDPEFSIMTAAKPFGQTLLKNRYNPKTIAKKSWDQLVENAEMLSDFPKDLKEITTTIKKGKMRLDIHVTEQQVFLQKLDTIVNRLSFSIILLSFSILMVGLIVGSAIAGQATVLWKFPAIEIGSVVATLMFIFMIVSIIRSGRM
ncbi:ABC1 kinase family protein [Ectobacillus sp. sgz5001026]|uniref:ABC1 kinase family protein n=1 Tax=Ectobacillus sp. sgz5001026 TaxID=3242473 RepID=UPI0036D3619A